jgi:hypothetical protein
MKKLFKYILKNKRDNFSIPRIIAVAILLIIVIFIIFIGSFLGVLYIEGVREENVSFNIPEKDDIYEEVDRTQMKLYPGSIIPDKMYDTYLDLRSYIPDSLLLTVSYMHMRVMGFYYRGNFYGEKLPYTFTQDEFEKIKGFKFLVSIDIDDAPINDISVLKGLRLESLSLLNTDVTDLTPLEGMPIKVLGITNCNIKDLSSLNGMPLENLHLDKTPVKDLSVLKGMPLFYVSLVGCKDLNDLTPLAECSQLRRVDVPSHIDEKGIEFLKNLPGMHEIWIEEECDNGMDRKLTWERPEEQL